MDYLHLQPLSILLHEVLKAPHGYIYLLGDHPWNADTEGLLFFTDIYGEVMLETRHPDFMRAKNLKLVMEIGRAEDAVRNAYFQKPNVSIAELVRCFNYHYAHSGYLDLSSDDIE